MRSIRQLRANRKAIGWSGMAAFVLFGAGSALWAVDMPDPGADADEVMRFYEKAADRIVVGGSLGLAAVVAFLYFGAGMRQVLSELDGDGVLADPAAARAPLGVAAGRGA